MRPTFLYDGDCAFCTSCARFIERRIPTTAEVVAWQFADLAALGVSRQQAEEAVQWIAGDGSVTSGPAAIAALLRHAGSYWRPLGVLLGARPVLWLAWPVYRLIARHRDKLPGGTAACALPQAERDRLRRNTGQQGAGHQHPDHQHPDHQHPGQQHPGQQHPGRPTAGSVDVA